MFVPRITLSQFRLLCSKLTIPLYSQLSGSLRPLQQDDPEILDKTFEQVGILAKESVAKDVNHYVGASLYKQKSLPHYNSSQTSLPTLPKHQHYQHVALASHTSLPAHLQPFNHDSMEFLPNSQYFQPYIPTIEPPYTVHSLTDLQRRAMEVTGLPLINFNINNPHTTHPDKNHSASCHIDTDIYCRSIIDKHQLDKEQLTDCMDTKDKIKQQDELQPKLELSLMGSALVYKLPKKANASPSLSSQNNICTCCTICCNENVMDSTIIPQHPSLAATTEQYNNLAYFQQQQQLFLMQHLRYTSYTINRVSYPKLH